ncbi:MAG: hypothetical protein ABI240_18990 [Sphingomonas sp.]
MMMAPFNPATLMMAIPAIMPAVPITTIDATVVTAVIAAVAAVIGPVIAIVMAATTIIGLRAGTCARTERSNREARRDEKMADLHGILSLPGDRAMAGNTITQAYRS